MVQQKTLQPPLHVLAAPHTEPYAVPGLST